MKLPLPRVCHAFFSATKPTAVVIGMHVRLSFHDAIIRCSSLCGIYMCTCRINVRAHIHATTHDDARLTRVYTRHVRARGLAGGRGSINKYAFAAISNLLRGDVANHWTKED